MCDIIKLQYDSRHLRYLIIYVSHTPLSWETYIMLAREFQWSETVRPDTKSIYHYPMSVLYWSVDHHSSTALSQAQLRERAHERPLSSCHDSLVQVVWWSNSRLYKYECMHEQSESKTIHSIILLNWEYVWSLHISMCIVSQIYNVFLRRHIKKYTNT